MEIFFPIDLKKNPTRSAQAGLPTILAHPSFDIKCSVRTLFGDQFVGKQDGLRKCKPSSTELGDRIKRLSTLNFEIKIKHFKT